MNPTERPVGEPAPDYSRVLLGAAVLVILAIVLIVALRPRTDPDQLWRAAQMSLKADRFDEAERLSERLARLREPTDGDLMLRAQVAIARDRVDEALAVLEELPESSTLAPQARLLAGQLELRRSRFRIAERHFLRALELDPKTVQARRELIFIYGYRSQPEALEAQFQQLAEAGPITSGDAFLWSLIRGVQWTPEEIVEVLAVAVERDPEDHASRIALADALMELTRFEEAESILAPLDPADPDARAALGRLALERGDVAGLRDLLAEAPIEHVGLALLRGKLALLLRDAEGAIAAYRKALDLRPNDRDALSGLSQALNQAGRREEAARIADQLNRVNALNNLLHEQAARGQANDVDRLIALGRACEAIGFRPQARAWYQNAVSIDPFSREAQEALARLDDAPDADHEVTAESSSRG